LCRDPCGYLKALYVDMFMNSVSQPTRMRGLPSCYTEQYQIWTCGGEALERQYTKTGYTENQNAQGFGYCT
jgi:hypothetical protein